MSYLALSVVLLIFAVGILGTLIPVLPGTIVAFSGVFIHKLWMGVESVSWTFVAICALIAAASLLFDWLFTWWGAKRYGASAKGALGAIVGGILGIFLLSPLIGLIVGPIAGAILFELMDGRDRPEALRAGWGTFIGSVAAFGVKMVCTVCIIGGFFAVA